MTWETVREAARSLTMTDRLRLVEDLWEEILADPSIAEISPEFEEELDRRLAQAEQFPESGRPWREVIAELKDRSHADSRPAT